MGRVKDFPCGTRVTHEYLGDGEIVKVIKPIIGYLVKFDKTPPHRYNMGQNPTLVFHSSLTTENERVDA